ncbi:alpha/beta hydrolase [Lysobacter claricitrinus]|uniref:alpha/beta hydrolase n=1 Tax=Lysobacter claricitrinus TaxID=3367728 RepID=UPI0037DB5D03
MKSATALRVSALAALLALALPALAASPQQQPRADDYRIMAPGVSPTPLHVRVLVPATCRIGTLPGCNALYIDDGQDADPVHLVDTVTSLAASGAISAPVVIAIDMPPDRMGAYGFSDRAAGRAIVAPTKYGDVGARAHAYSEWLVHTLVPFVESRYAVRPSPDARAILGWSLGGAHAFNVGWQYPEVFARVGAFSPSFWLATDRTDATTLQRTRIAQSMVATMPPRTGARFFVAIGTDEETSDRDGDGINDAVDDVRDLVDGWNVDAGGVNGLRQAGYRINDDAAHRTDDSDVALYVLDGGHHQQASWARMLPVFLRWAYPAHAP